MKGANNITAIYGASSMLYGHYYVFVAHFQTVEIYSPNNTKKRWRILTCFAGFT